MKRNFPRAWSLTCLPVAALLVVSATSVHAQKAGGASVNSRVVLHDDGTKTESMKDPVRRQQSETTYDTRGVVIAEKVFHLNENGDPMQGVIYDGGKNLVARVQFYFDDLGRVVEERCVNTRNEIFRRVIRRYDKSGKPLPPEAFDFKVNAPNMKVSTINFTEVPAMAPRSPSAPPAQAAPLQAGQTPKIQSVSPQRPAAPASTPPAAEKEKRKLKLFWKN